VGQENGPSKKPQDRVKGGEKESDAVESNDKTKGGGVEVCRGENNQLKVTW